MSNLFNIKRAANYFVHDLNTAKNNYLYSMLVVGLSPILVFVIIQIFSLIFEGRWGSVDTACQYIVAFASLVVLSITFPIKQYGRITDKKYGSDWLMLPASTLEKWLSLIVMCCVVMPIVYMVLFLGSDWLLSVAFPSLYPKSLVSTCSAANEITEALRIFSEEAGMKISLVGASYASWCENVLVMALGAVVFKNAKFPKTLLSMIAISIVFTSLLSLLGHIELNITINESEALDWLASDDAEMFAKHLKIIVNVTYLLVFTALGGGLFLRFKTLKH